MCGGRSACPSQILLDSSGPPGKESVRGGPRVSAAHPILTIPDGLVRPVIGGTQHLRLLAGCPDHRATALLFGVVRSRPATTSTRSLAAPPRDKPRAAAPRRIRGQRRYRGRYLHVDRERPRPEVHAAQPRHRGEAKATLSGGSALQQDLRKPTRSAAATTDGAGRTKLHPDERVGR